METCRLCSKSRNVNDVSKLNDKKLEITKKLQEAFSIKLDSTSSPKFCCRICLNKLNSSYTFYQQVVENQKKFEICSNFQFDTVVVKEEKLDDRSFGGTIKVENEEHFEDDYGDSFGGDFYGDSNDYKEDQEDDQSFEFVNGDEGQSNIMKISSVHHITSHKREDYDHLYNEYESPQVTSALSLIGIENLDEIFKREKIDFQLFQSLDKADFYELLKDFPLGIKKKMFMQFETWRISLVPQANISGGTSEFKPINQVLQQNLSIGFQKTAKRSYNEADDVTIQKILDTTEAGRAFKISMKKKSSLLTKEKRKLVDIIVKYFMQHKIKLFKADFMRLAEEIPNIFPQELSETYFSDDGKLGGILYFKYNNTLSMYRKNDQMSCLTKKRKIDKDSKAFSENAVTFGSEEISSDEYVRSSVTENSEKLLLHWKVSSKFRKHRIKTMYSNITEIFNDYKAYTKPDGYMLEPQPRKSVRIKAKKVTKSSKKPSTAASKSKKYTKTNKKSSKSSKKKIKSKQPVLLKEDLMDLIYKNEIDGKFTDTVLRLNIEPTEYLADGRLTAEAELRYSTFKWSNNQFKCTEGDGKCEENFENIIELNSHLKSAHNKKYKSVCNQCGIISSNFSGFVTHTIKYHNTNARFSCIICSTIFWNLNDLFKHYRNEHSNRILMCLYCGFHYNTTQVLKTHLMQIHKHVDNRGIFFCDICNFSTKTKQSMTSHMMNHMQSTGEICDQCGTIFRRRGALEMHKNFIHGNQETVECHCGKIFKNLLSLRKHKKIVHQKYMHVYNHECSFCDKKFRTPYQLKCHMYSHNPNSARYKCPHCGKGFRYTTGYKYHIRSAHTMEKPYGCPCCDNRFFDYANAHKHVKGSHGGDFKPIRVD